MCDQLTKQNFKTNHFNHEAWITTKRRFCFILSQPDCRNDVSVCQLSMHNLPHSKCQHQTYADTLHIHAIPHRGPRPAAAGQPTSLCGSCYDSRADVIEIDSGEETQPKITYRGTSPILGSEFSDVSASALQIVKSPVQDRLGPLPQQHPKTPFSLPDAAEVKVSHTHRTGKIIIKAIILVQV